jgi:hypothetical protein
MTTAHVLDEPFADEADLRLADAYLTRAGRYKTRRLVGLIVLCTLLLGVLLLVFAKDWYAQSGGGGAGWIVAGIAVAVAAIAGVVIDILYRKEL